MTWDIPYNSWGIRPVQPSNEYLVGALGVSGKGGWTTWAIDKIIIRCPNDPELIQRLKQASQNPDSCNKAYADYTLFRLRKDPEKHLTELINMAESNREPCAMNVLEYRITPEDQEFDAIFLDFLSSDDLYIQIACRSALHSTGWSFDDIDLLGLKPLSEY